jgi:hypothetical protein
MRELELGAITTALEQSGAGGAFVVGHHHLRRPNNNLHPNHVHNREEARAVRRKYVEERRARILQLFEPVRMVRTVNTILLLFFLRLV